MSNGKLNIGIIGCGGIANQKHMPALAKLGHLGEMVAFCDVVEEKAVNAAGQFGVENAKVYIDYKELLKDEFIDVVHVLTPNLQHSFITLAALEAGKHVMCEKPMAINSAEAQEMIDAANRTGKKLTIGYQNRFREDSQILHQASSAGEFGDIYYTKAHAIRRRGVPTWGVFLDVEQQGGGPLIDIGTHSLDLALWTMDNYKPKSVTGSVFHKLADKHEGNLFGAWDPKTFDVEDSAFGFIKMQNGATIILECSWALNTTDVREAMVSLSGTEGGAEMKGNPSAGGDGQLVFNSTKYGKLIETEFATGGGIAYFDGSAEDPGVIESRQWLESIINDTEPLVKPEQALVVTQILEAIYESARTGKTIEFPED